MDTMTKIPIIIVEDWSGPSLPHTILYIRKNNVLLATALFNHIKTLRSLQDCKHNSKPGPHCKSCKKLFRCGFWVIARVLIDYFADFYLQDSEQMHVMWFQMVDTWQECATGYLRILANAEMARPHPHRSILKYAGRYMKRYDATLEMLRRLFNGLQGASIPQESFVHSPFGDYSSAFRPWNSGPYLSGMKPWQQFLFAGSPGCAHVDLPKFDANQKTSKSEGEAQPSEHDAQNEMEVDTPSQYRSEEPTAWSTDSRVLPHPAVAIMRTHINTIRSRIQALHPDDIPDLPRVLPHKPRGNKVYQHTYTPSVPATNLTSTPQQPENFPTRTLDFHYLNGAPPVIPPDPDQDPEFTNTEPTFQILNEYLGLATRAEQYRGVDWNVDWEAVDDDDGGDGDEDEDEEQEGERGDGLGFDLLVVNGTDGSMFGDMYDEWEL